MVKNILFYYYMDNEINNNKIKVDQDNLSNNKTNANSNNYIDPDGNSSVLIFCSCFFCSK